MRYGILACACACTGGPPAASPPPAPAPLAPPVVASLAACGQPPASGCFVAVPAGAFTQGAQRASRATPDWDPDAAPEEGPPRRVTLPAYWIQATEAPWWMYERCITHGVCGEGPRPPAGSTELPVTGLTWPEAGVFCGWLGGRLPTEAEWERAAKGPDNQRFSWGNLPLCPSSAADEMEAQTRHRDGLMQRCGPVVTALFDEVPQATLDRAGRALDLWDAAKMDTVCRAATGRPDATAVFMAAAEAALAEAASAPARQVCRQSAAVEVRSARSEHPWGLHGQSGNAYEWTADGWDSAAYTKTSAESPLTPTAPDGRRALRGGSWLAQDGREWRTTARVGMAADLSAADVGVRCVRDAPP